MVLGMKLRQWRRANFYSLQEAADRVTSRSGKPVAPSTVKRWEDGAIPHPAQQRSLMEVLGISPEEFRAIIDGDEAKRKQQDEEGKE